MLLKTLLLFLIAKSAVIRYNGRTYIKRMGSSLIGTQNKREAQVFSITKLTPPQYKISLHGTGNLALSNKGENGADDLILKAYTGAESQKWDFLTDTNNKNQLVLFKNVHLSYDASKNKFITKNGLMESGYIEVMMNNFNLRFNIDTTMSYPVIPQNQPEATEEVRQEPSLPLKTVDAKNEVTLPISATQNNIKPVGNEQPTKNDEIIEEEQNKETKNELDDTKEASVNAPDNKNIELKTEKTPNLEERNKLIQNPKKKKSEEIRKLEKRETKSESDPINEQKLADNIKKEEENTKKNLNLEYKSGETLKSNDDSNIKSLKKDVNTNKPVKEATSVEGAKNNELIDNEKIDKTDNKQMKEEEDKEIKKEEDTESKKEDDLDNVNKLIEKENPIESDTSNILETLNYVIDFTKDKISEHNCDSSNDKSDARKGIIIKNINLIVVNKKEEANCGKKIIAFIIEENKNKNM